MAFVDRYPSAGVIIGAADTMPTADDLKVVPSSGLVVEINEGQAYVNSAPKYVQTGSLLLSISKNTRQYERKDMIVLRQDAITNDIQVRILEGVTSLQVSRDFFDLPLAIVTIPLNLATLTTDHIQDLRRASNFVEGADEQVTLEPADEGISLVADGLGPHLETKTLTAGDGIEISSTAESITITNTGSSTNAGVACVVTKAEDQEIASTFPARETGSQILFDVVEVDTHNMFDEANNWIVIQEDGVYTCQLGFRWQLNINPSTAVECYLKLTRDEVTYEIAYGESNSIGGTPATQPDCQCFRTIPLFAGDIIFGTAVNSQSTGPYDVLAEQFNSPHLSVVKVANLPEEE